MAQGALKPRPGFCCEEPSEANKPKKPPPGDIFIVVDEIVVENSVGLDFGFHTHVRVLVNLTSRSKLRCQEPELV